MRPILNFRARTDLRAPSFRLRAAALMRIAAFTVLAAVLLVSASSACTSEPDCPSHAYPRCAGSELQTCTPHPGFYSADFHHYPASPSTWQDPVADCGAADLCHESTFTSSDGTTTPDALCSLDPAPAPACVALEGASNTAPASACEGTTSVDCEDGFALRRHVCRACTSGGTCAGGNLATCTTASDCAPGLDCVNESCFMPCACPEGAPCAACDRLESDAPGESEYSFVWACTGGFCSQLSQ